MVKFLSVVCAIAAFIILGIGGIKLANFDGVWGSADYLLAAIWALVGAIFFGGILDDDEDKDDDNDPDYEPISVK